MIKLHLVEPKTNRRLKLGEDFGYYGKWINCFEDGRFEVDEKDPLGDDPMFNGRTYGNGRFILCEGEA